jgi:hypothetical protein
MSNETMLPTLDRIRSARAEISAHFDHDIRRMIAYYQQTPPEETDGAEVALEIQKSHHDENFKTESHVNLREFTP